MPQQCTPIQLPMLLDGVQCKRCGEVKSPDDFALNPRKRNGLHSYCRSCCRDIHNDWRRRNPDYEKNRRIQNPEYERLKQQRWERAYPEKARARRAAREHSYRFNQANAAGRLTPKVAAAIKERDGGKCLCCGSTTRITVDHIVPLSRGGTNLPDNLQTLCLSCNARKHAKVIDYRLPQTSGD